MKKNLLITIFALISATTFAQMHHELDEVVVSSTKETNELRKLPAAVTFITPSKIASRGIVSLKDINSMVPNLYMPDYGSKMTSPIYLRGVGARSSSQSVGIYVDGIPYMDKSTFDFELMDVSMIEILRGPQGTLYGRNAMGGIINIYTLSPLEYSGTRASIGGGNHGTFSAKLSHYAPVSSRVGISVGGYYDRSSGYFTNKFTGDKVDGEESAGANLKLEARLTNHLTMKINTSFDYTDQGAFPYGLYHKDTKETDQVNFNEDGSYRRTMANGNLRFEYRKSDILFSSNTGYQYLDDNMMMDQDFTEKSIFTINQRQKQNSFNQEFAARSTSSGKYQWSVGAFGFYNDMETAGDVVFGKDGIQGVIQPKIDEEMTAAGAPMRLRIDDESILNPGEYDTPAMGVALFHQSTFNITDKFSITAGVRLDYEKQWLKYNTTMEMNTTVVMKPPKPPVEMGKYQFVKNLTGELDQSFTQFLPKIAAKYEFNDNVMVYSTISKGYKAGGYNNQMFSEVIQDSIKRMRPPGMPVPEPKGDGDLSKVVSYKPEITWNYEVGMRASVGFMSFEVAGFYMDISDLQLTQFVNGGSGRILSNSGRGRSFGAEVSINAKPTPRLMLDLNYGYSNSKFTKYDAGEKKKDEDVEKVDYTGNYVPYTPQNTLSAGALYNFVIRTKSASPLIIGLGANYTACGKIYWTEKNDVEQPFYGTLNSQVSFSHKNTKLEFWGRNLTSTDYGAFYFESFGKSFVQKGKPFTCGVNLVLSF